MDAASAPFRRSAILRDLTGAREGSIARGQKIVRKPFRALAVNPAAYGDKTMDKDRIEGSAKNLKGKVKEQFGKLSGDSKTEAEGKFDQAEGKTQNAVGGMKDKARELLDDK